MEYDSIQPYGSDAVKISFIFDQDEIEAILAKGSLEDGHEDIIMMAIRLAVKRGDIIIN